VLDVVVLPIAQWEAMATREAGIELSDPPPILVAVVSESTVSTDYRAKHSEYSVLEIAEYWIVDPLKACVTVCRTKAATMMSCVLERIGLSLRFFQHCKSVRLRY
jgi:Uma2 family endonuclease